MTPQERAAAIAEQIVKALDVHPSPINIDAVLPWVQQTRRAALMEAARVAREWPWEQPASYADPLRQARCRGNREASSDIAAVLDRLASEGV